MAKPQTPAKSPTNGSDKAPESQPSKEAMANDLRALVATYGLAEVGAAIDKFCADALAEETLKRLAVGSKVKTVRGRGAGQTGEVLFVHGATIVVRMDKDGELKTIPAGTLDIFVPPTEAPPAP